MNELDLRAVEARLEAVADLEMRVAESTEGKIRIVGRLGDEEVEIEVRRDLMPAEEGDLRFVGGALADMRHLLRAIRSGEQPTSSEIAAIESRVASASPGPWTAFIETDGGQAGCDVIRVSERDDQPDMYLWTGSDLAPSRLFRLIAAARQDIPALLALVCLCCRRRRQCSGREAGGAGGEGGPGGAGRVRGGEGEAEGKPRRTRRRPRRTSGRRRMTRRRCCRTGRGTLRGICGMRRRRPGRGR